MSHATRSGFSQWVLPLCALCLGGSFTLAGTPRLARLTPPGGQRGTTVEVEFFGRNLHEPKEVVFYEPGITAVSVEPMTTAIGTSGKPQPVEAGSRVRVRLKIAENCQLGAHGVRLRTADGISEYARFFVGPFPTVDETEVSGRRVAGTPEPIQDVDANVTVFGRLNEASDTDIYRVRIKRGERLSAEVESSRLGGDRGLSDLHLTLRDPDGKVLASADDSALFVQDPTLSVVADKDGAYLVEVRHSVFNGNGDVYRLHVGTFTRPTATYPAGGQIGTDLTVKLLGDPKGPWTQTVRLPAAPGDVAFVPVADGVPAPSPHRLRASPFPNVLEVEPNDTPEATPANATTTLPVAFNGIIDKAGDVDCFRFMAKKGESFRFYAMANALGSPVDPVIWVKSLSGKGGVTRANDSRPNQLGTAPAGGFNRDQHDAILEFTANADGEYVLGVENERGDGGPDFVYRVEAAPPVNEAHTYIAPEPENQNQPQARQAVAVPAGNRTTAQIAVFTTNRPLDGEYELVGVNLPRGVTLTAPTLAPGRLKVPVVFEAAPDAPPAAALVDLALRPVGGGPALPGGFRQIVAMNGYGNNDYYLHVPVDRLAVAVTDPAPFRVEVEEPKSALVQNGEMTLRFRVIRSDGFDGPVSVLMDLKPLGLSTATPATVKAGETAGTYQLGAARNAAPGTHSLTLTAVAGGVGRLAARDGSSRTIVASAPFKLTVAEPHVEAKIGRTSIERGKTATLTCKLTHLQAFEGAATATLSRLPRGVELVEPTQSITGKDKEVSFTLRATPEALVGNYQGIVLDVTVTDKGQAVRQLSGSGVLRIDAERGVSAKGK